LSVHLVWVCITTAIHGAISLEGLYSSSRLLLSTLVAYAIHRYLTLRSVAFWIFVLALVNSIIVIIQLFDAISGDVYLPEWLKYGANYGFEDVEIWRKGGILPALQTSSLLSLYGIIYGVHRERRLLTIFFPTLLITILVGARTFVPIAIIVVAYATLRMPFAGGVWILLVAWVLPGVEGFTKFFELRYAGLVDVFFRLDFSADYSAADTMTSYREISLMELLLGNGQNRYSEVGGLDPFYTRWLLQSGAPSVILLSLTLLIMSIRCGRYSFIAYFILIISFYHNIKGELFTSVGVYDLLCLVAFMFLRAKSRCQGQAAIATSVRRSSGVAGN
jgi:hypothetical protein